MYPKSSGQSHRQVTRSPTSARDELLAWAKARNLRDRAVKYQNDAREASDRGVQRRLNDIAQHYRLAAAAEAKDAGRLGNERREKSKISENGTFGGRAAIETIRLKLRQFAGQQTDQVVRARCLALDQKLAEISEGNDLNLRQVLADHIQHLERALRRSAEKGLIHPQSNEPAVTQGCSLEEEALRLPLTRIT
jgi:hypothetical protein